MIEFEPVSARERLRTLDVLRGCALLGILMMNIPYFAMPAAAYAQLNAWGGNGGANLWTFFIQWTLFEGKMRALFSILFGAGIILFIDHATARRDSIEVGDLLQPGPGADGTAAAIPVPFSSSSESGRSTCSGANGGCRDSSSVRSNGAGGR